MPRTKLYVPAGSDAGGSWDAQWVALGDSPVYVPPDAINWYSSYWAEGDEFTALGIADGGAVQTWPDETNAVDLTQATSSKRPLYRASVAALNDKPALEGDVTDDAMNSGTLASALVQPHTYVLIGFVPNVSSEHRMMVGGSVDGVTVGPILSSGPSGGNFRSYSGLTWLDDGVSNTNPHLFIAEFNDTSSKFQVDGTEYTGGSGTHSTVSIWLFSDRSGGSNGVTIAFAAVYNGILTQQEKDDLLAWSRSHYGTP